MLDKNNKINNEEITSAIANLNNLKNKNQFENIYLDEKTVVDIEKSNTFFRLNGEKLTVQDAGKCDLAIFPKELSSFKFADIKSFVSHFNKSFVVEEDKTSKYYFQRIFLNLTHNNRPTKFFLWFYCGSKGISFTQGTIAYFENQTWDSSGFVASNVKPFSSLFLEDFSKTSSIYLLQAYAFQNDLDISIDEKVFELSSFIVPI
jgi:hypothetical protein